MDNRTLFYQYLTSCVKTTRSTQNNPLLLAGNAPKDYMRFLESEKLFDYDPKKWQGVDMYNVSDAKKAENIFFQLINDPAFQARNNNDNQGWRQGAISHYVCFLKARHFFNEIDNFNQLSESNSDTDYINFKHLLEYFCAHLQYIVTNDENIKGYDEYLKTFVDNGTFKKSGQGYKQGQNIQKQIQQWEHYKYGKVCINVYGSSFQSYATYLHWIGTGFNISANWNGNKITTLQPVEYLGKYKWDPKPTKFTMDELGLYDGNEPNDNLKALYDAFVAMLLDDSNKSKNAETDAFVFVNSARQVIYYGAPGTGKSHTIKKMENEENYPLECIRTTFHPDSDYSTFVGAYKPTMQKNANAISKFFTANELAEELKKYYNDASTGKIEGIQLFCLKYAGCLSNIKTKDLVELAGISSNYSVEIDKYTSFVNRIPKQEDSKIIYSFIPQTFLQAYIKAWSNPGKEYALVIEEINRGNCAQIFGDIFQLLDRDSDGWSSYPIMADSDIADYLESLHITGYSDAMAGRYGSDKAGYSFLALPPNLSILATMNTSDQSLFPIDSAFKRRWDWKYVPIDTEKENWAIEVNGVQYSWTSFLEIINDKILNKTNSEDKQLGFYFCKADNKVISADKFVSKVLFFIYNDVYKDYGFDDDLFKDKDNNTLLSFRKYYDRKGNINEEYVEKFLKNLSVEVVDEFVAIKDLEDDTPDAGKLEHKESLVAITVNGVRLSSDNYTQFDLYLETIKRLGVSTYAPIIENMKYKRKGCKMASQTPQEAINGMDGYSYVEADGYYFIKGAKSYTLIRILEDLIKMHNLDIIIEYK